MASLAPGTLVYPGVPNEARVFADAVRALSAPPSRVVSANLHAPSPEHMPLGHVAADIDLVTLLLPLTPSSWLKGALTSAQGTLGGLPYKWVASPRDEVGRATSCADVGWATSRRHVSASILSLRSTAASAAKPSDAQRNAPAVAREAPQCSVRTCYTPLGGAGGCKVEYNGGVRLRYGKLTGTRTFRPTESNEAVVAAR